MGTLPRIELHHMLKKRQWQLHQNTPAWKQFYLLAA